MVLADLRRLVGSGRAMSLERNKQLARDFLHALERRDRPRLLELLAPDARWGVPRSAPAPYAGMHRGRERIVELMLGASEHAFAPGTHRIEILLLLAETDAVCAEVRMTARTPRGTDYENGYVFLFELAGGQIRELREHVDTRHAAAFFEA
jgi:ketosteroid isomerase-like protein